MKQAISLLLALLLSRGCVAAPAEEAMEIAVDAVGVPPDEPAELDVIEVLTDDLEIPLALDALDDPAAEARYAL